jgi:hypothetical protein
MQIYYAEVSLEEGFSLSDLPKDNRLIKGKQFSLCSGFSLFSSMRHQPIKCYNCSCTADRWITTMGPNDQRSYPVLNLYGVTKKGKLRLMTRDHIIPKSLGGVDDVANLRPACDVCNLERSNHLSAADRAFMDANPHLVNEERKQKGLKARAENEARKAAAKELAVARAAEHEELMAEIKPFDPVTHEQWKQYIGKRVEKRRSAIREPKPFKSGFKVNTVKAIHRHPYTPHLAFSFYEDDSLVECFRCVLLPDAAQPEQQVQG